MDSASIARNRNRRLQVGEDGVCLPGCRVVAVGVRRGGKHWRLRRERILRNWQLHRWGAGAKEREERKMDKNIGFGHWEVSFDVLMWNVNKIAKDRS